MAEAAYREDFYYSLVLYELIMITNHLSAVALGGQLLVLAFGNRIRILNLLTIQGYSVSSIETKDGRCGLCAHRIVSLTRKITLHEAASSLAC